MKKRGYLRGSSLERATRRSRFTTGGSSRCCSHPTGGDDGGEMRKVFSFLGGSRNGLVFFSFMGFKTKLQCLSIKFNLKINRSTNKKKFKRKI